MEIFWGIMKAFLVGGLFCAVAQVLIDKTRLTPARILVTYVCAGVALSGMGIYEKLMEISGAGASVPLTGFGHVLAQGVERAVDTYGALGIITGGLTGAAAGITAAMTFGLIAALIAPSRPK